MAARHSHSNSFVQQRLFYDLENFSELESRISALPTEMERGNAFEVFAEAYFATQKIRQAVEVWPGNSIPQDILKAHHLPLRDLGADGVFRNQLGKLNAYQVKYRSGRAPLNWEELGTFMGLTDQVDHRVLFTNSDTIPAVMNQRSRFDCTRGTDLDRLLPADFVAINDWLQTGKFHLVQKTPLPHQEEALLAIASGLSEHNRATSVMACGTGKTLVALWLAERLKSRRIVVLVPSLALIRQTLHEWLKETNWDAPRFICVCSDPTVTRSSDEVIVRQSEVDFPVTTNTEDVRKFLLEDSIEVQVVFTTYQSSRVVGEAAKTLPPFDLGIFDEAHKTAGREGTSFGFALNDDNIKIAKRLFLTATPRHFDVGNKNKEGDATEVFSMDVPEIYGPRVFTLPFAEAARRGIICDYKVIISVITSDMVNDQVLRHGEVLVDGDIVRARQVANQIAIQKACDEYDLKKIFTFHTRVETAREFTGEGAQSIASYLPDYSALHISGDMPTARRETLMKAFREADKAIISNARCLTEGVDVPAVDMVAFLSPKKSKVDIVQATGRAMRKAENKTIGYVMVPLYLEIATGETIESALARTDFEEIWNVLQAMKEQDSVLEDIIRQLRIEKGRAGSFDDNRTHERIEFLGPKLSIEGLRHAIAVSIIDRLGSSWDERYGELERFKQIHGHCNVPARWTENPQLASWASGQRKAYKNGKLQFPQVKLLEELGFEWNVLDMAWEVKFGELKCYKEKYGNCDVPNKWSDNPQLARWVGNQRKAKISQKLELERERLLDDLGFEWDAHASVWNTSFAELQHYKKQYGDCNVPQDWAANLQLGRWVSHQRTAKRKGKLNAKRISLLDALVFEWKPSDTEWKAKFAELVRYKREYGNCDIPSARQEYRQLATWASEQRKAYKKGKLELEQAKQLENLGFAWDLFTRAWEEKFAELECYRKIHGDCNVPNTWQENPQLGLWVGTQRLRKRTGKLPSEQMNRLDNLDFEWNVLATAWEIRFAELVEYQKDHGHSRVPINWSKNKALATWVSEQRKRKRKGDIETERVKRLEDIGFEWDLLVTAWETKFTELEQYKMQKGDCNVHAKWPENPSLGIWVANQRIQRRKGRLESERVKRLDNLGFRWTKAE